MSKSILQKSEVNGDGESAYPHDFKRDPSTFTCYACFDMWAPNQTSVCKCYTCSRCGVSVHAGCRTLALRDYPCVPSTNSLPTVHSHAMRFPSTACDWEILHEKVVDGNFLVQIKHAYDVEVTVGCGLYGIYRLVDVPTSTPTYSQCNTAVRRSKIAFMGDNDCSWEFPHDAQEMQRTMSAVSTTASSTIPFTAWPHLRTSNEEHTGLTEMVNDSSGSELKEEIHTGCLEVELWRCGYVPVLDVMVGKCNVKILPLLAHSGIVVERWFSIEDGDGQQSGMVLLRLCFKPSVLSSKQQRHESLLSETTEVEGSGDGVVSKNDGECNSAEIGDNHRCATDDTLLSPSAGMTLTQSPIEEQDTVSEDIEEESRHDLQSSQELSVGPETDFDFDADTDHENVMSSHVHEDEDLPINNVDVLCWTQHNISATSPLRKHSEESTERPLGSVGDKKPILNDSEGQDYSEMVTMGSNQFGESTVETLPTSLEKLDTKKIGMVDDTALLTTSIIPPPYEKSDASSLSSTLSMWAYDFVFSSSTTRKKKGHGGNTRAVSGNTKEVSSPRKHAHLLETAAASVGDSSSISKSCEVEARLKDVGEGVGSIYIYLGSAHKNHVRDDAGCHYYVVMTLLADPNKTKGLCTPHPTTVTSDHPLPTQHDGDVDLESPFLFSLLDQEEESRIVFSSSSPSFNSTFHFIVPHFHCTLQFTLVDATKERKIGSSKPISIFSLLQRQADIACFESNLSTTMHKQEDTTKEESMDNDETQGGQFSSNKQKCGSSSRSLFDNYFGTLKFTSADPIPVTRDTLGIEKSAHENHKSSDSCESIHDLRCKKLAEKARGCEGCEIYPMLSSVDSSREIGHFEACLRFRENYEELFLDSHPQLALIPPEEQMDLDRVGTHFSRVGAVISAYGWLFDRYNNLMSWKNPVQTFVIMMLFIYCCLYVEAEYALCVPLFLLVYFFTESWINRHFGNFRTQHITPNDNPLDEYSYRPVSYLHLAVSGFRNFGRPGAPKTPPPHMSLSYLPDGPVGNVFLTGLDGKGSYHKSTKRNAMATASESEALFPELHIASFFVPPSLLGAQDVPLLFRHREQKFASSSTAGKPATNFMTSLNIVAGDHVINDSILHNVSEPLERKGIIKHLITEALVTSESNTIGLDNSNGKKGIISESLRQQRIKSYLDEPDIAYVYPILQKPRPIGLSTAKTIDSTEVSSPSKRCTTKPSSNKCITTQFEPWSTSPAVIKFTLRGSSSGVGGKIMDNIWGHVYFPISTVAKAIDAQKKTKENNKISNSTSFLNSILYSIGVKRGGEIEDNSEDEPEVCVWCDVQWSPSFAQTFKSTSYPVNIGDLDNPYSVITESKEFNEMEIKNIELDCDNSNPDFAKRSDMPDLEQSKKLDSSSTTLFHHNSGNAQMLIRIRLDKSMPQMSTDEAKGIFLDASNHNIPGVSCREVELSRIIQSIAMPKIKKKSSTISTLWNARDHIKFVQNKLGGIVGTVESFKNIFNWTQPVKTLPLYLLVVGVWILTMFIPGRYLILILGLSEFVYEFTTKPEVLPMKSRFYNLLASIPNDDDLKKIYSKERESLMTSHEMKLKKQRHKLKLNMIQPCSWCGLVGIDQNSISTASVKRSNSAAGDFDCNGLWEERFLVVQGYRLAWWGNEGDVDAGLGPIDEILLHGHAGITQPSPVVVKEVGDDKRLIAVFGRDTYGLPLKHTILCRDVTACKQLKSVIHDILTKST